MGRGLIGSVDVAPVLCQDDLKQLDGLRPAFFSPILPETHVVGTLDQILYDPFPQQVGEGYPIDLRLSIALKKRSSGWEWEPRPMQSPDRRDSEEPDIVVRRAISS